MQTKLIFVKSPLTLVAAKGHPGRTLCRLLVTDEVRKDLEKVSATLTFSEARKYCYTLWTSDAVQPYASLDGYIDETGSDATSIMTRYHLAA